MYILIFYTVFLKKCLPPRFYKGTFLVLSTLFATPFLYLISTPTLLFLWVLGCSLATVRTFIEAAMFMEGKTKRLPPWPRRSSGGMRPDSAEERNPNDVSSSSGGSIRAACGKKVT
jgi:hypothetical protein